MTRPYAEVIGDPIAHSKSPLIHNFWLGKLGIDAEYRACHVRPDELEDYFTRRRGDAEWRGCNVTVPHKISSLEFVDETADDARLIGATNCIVHDGPQLRAWNTDSAGFAEPLDRLMPAASAQLGAAYVIGSGGAARAAAHALLQRNWLLTFVARNRNAAREIADDLSSGSSEHVATMAFEQFQALVLDSWLDRPQPPIQIVVNATPMGMADFSVLPFRIGSVMPGTIVYDMVYSPLETQLLADARTSGLPTIDGLQMLIGQASEAFKLFFGQPAPREHDAELRALLTA